MIALFSWRKQSLLLKCLLGVFLFSITITTLSASTATAAANPEAEIKTYSEKWLYYRALVGCYSQHGVGKTSLSSTNAGKWFDRNGNDSNTNLGYLGSSDKIACGTGSMVTSANAAIGWSSNIDAFCSIQPMAQSNGGESKDDCMAGTKDFDLDGTNNNDKQVSQFKTAKGKMGDSGKFPYDGTGAIKYYVYKRSLEKWCGNNNTISASNTAPSNGNNAVSVHYVDTQTGEIKPSVIYKLGAGTDQGKNVPNLWWKKDGGECKNVAQGTRDNAQAYATQVITLLNEGVASDLKAGVGADTVVNANCDNNIPLPGCRSSATTAGAIIDICSKKSNVQPVKMEKDKRVLLIKDCAIASLPKELADIVGGINPTIDDAPETTNQDELTTTCAVEKIGWIICPVSESIADGVDEIFELVADFLVVESFTSGQTGMKNAWNYMLNFANICFIIAFLFIVYSQITGAGISNYGVKKLLPRLVIAAVLVNTSYWICALAVDLSNVAGYSVNNLFEIIRNQTGATAGTPGTQVTWADFISTVLTGSVVGGVAAYSALAGAGSAVALLWAAVPLLIAALFAIFVALLVLAARQALLVILVVVAPLAFVAYLLPNTQKWFDKWRELFTTLLLMFPIIAALFGGSQLASAVILSTANSLLTVLLALAVQFIPLAATPVIMKFSGGLLNRLGGIVNDRSKGILDKTKNAAKERQELATKRGVAQGNNFLNRMGRRRDLGMRRRKSQGDQYEAESESRFQRSNRGSAQVQSTAYAQQNVKQQTALNTNSGQLAHVANNRGLYSSVYDSEDKLKTEQQRSKNDYSASQQGRTNAQDSKVAEKTGSNIAQQQENTYLASRAGERQSAAGKKLGDENKRLEAIHEEEYLNSNTGERTRTRLIDAQGAQAIAEQNVKNVQAASVTGLAQAETLLVVKGAGDGITKQVQLSYDQSGIGQTQNQQIAELSDQINLQQLETNDAAKSSIIGEQTAAGKAIAEQRSQLTTKRAEAALENNAEYINTRMDAETAGQEAKTVADRIDTQVRSNSSYINAALESDTAAQGLSIADSRLETEKIEANEDERIAAQSAKDTTTASQASLDARVAELRTEEGATKYGLQGDPVVQELQSAATQQRVQRQRASSAENIGNVEYATQVSASQGVAGGLAEVAGGIDPYGARRAVSAAEQVEIEQFNKNVSTEKSTMSSLNDEQLYSIATDSSESTERRAAAAGSIMKSGSMGNIHNLVEHFKETIPVGTAEASVVKNIQMQMSSDISRTPFGFGDTDLAALRRGQLGQAVEQYGEDGNVVLDSVTGEPILSADTRSYDEMITDRVKRKMSGEAWSKMDPDDRSRILNIAQNNPNLLGDEGRKNLLQAFADINNTDTLKAATKTDAKQRANAIAEALGENPVFTNDNGS